MRPAGVHCSSMAATAQTQAILNLPLRVFHAVEKSIRVIEILDCTSTTI
jgi:hypothetical protein